MITGNEWRNLTGVTRTSLESKNFKAIEAALRVYEKSPSKTNLQAIIQAVADWKMQKFEKYSAKEKDPALQGDLNFWMKSKRHNQVLYQSVKTSPIVFLTDEIVRAGQLYHMFPVMEPDWKAGPYSENCYAYAMKCREPKSQGDPVPGGFEGKNQLLGSDLVDYYKRLIAGVIQDGAKQSIKIRVGFTAKGYDADHASEADLSLPPPRDNHYRAVVIAALTGFHWFRCDETTGFWTQKNGPNNLPDGVVNDEGDQRPVAITDDVLIAMLKSPLHSRYGQLDAKFHYLACFYVPDGGMKVFRQPTPAPDYKGESWWTAPRLDQIITAARV